MSISPYDNLPTGKDDEFDDGLHYVDVEIEEEYREEPPTEESSLLPEEPAPPEESSPPNSPVHTEPQPPAPPLKTTPLQTTPHYSAHTISNLWSTDEYILPFEESLLVPDAQPDMEKLLFAEGNTRQTRIQKSGYTKDDFLSGSITVFTVYKPAAESGSSIDVVKSIIPFKTDKCWGDEENAIYKASVSIKTISAEMVNERKFIIKGELSIKCNVILKKELKTFESINDENLIRATETINATCLDFETEETTDISQDINIKESQPAPVKILKESISITENHRQVTTGKLVINATIHSRVLYIGDEDGGGKLCCLTNKTDFTQFIPVKDNIDINLLNISFTADDLKISIENKNMFLLSGTIHTTICGYRNAPLNMTRDAYHKKCELVFDALTCELSCIKDTVSGEISAREVVEIPETPDKPETLLYGTGHIISLVSRYEKGRIIIDGSVAAKILALDEKGNPLLIESSLPLRGTLETHVSGEDLSICTDSALKELWFSAINSRQLEINVTIWIKTWVSGKETLITPENLRFTEKDTAEKRISMAIYVTGAKDTLWDIAKRYRSDTDTIARLNHLDPGKPLAAGTKIFLT